MGITEAFNKLKITPNQALQVLGIVKMAGFVTTTSAGTSVMSPLMQGDVNGAWSVLQKNANSLFDGGEKYTELINFITKFGVIKLVMQLISMIGGAIGG